MASANFLRRRRQCLTLLLLGSLFNWILQAFVDPKWPVVRKWSCARGAGAAESSLEEIQKMRAKEIKKELVDEGIDVSDIFEKDELVTRLHQLRSGTLPVPPPAPPEKEEVAEPGSSAPAAADFMARCRDMTTKELRTELGQRGIGWADALEKDELVERLATVLAKESAFCSSGRLKPGVVAKITGKELEEELADSTTPLLLDVYATWCGPCKQMEPQLAAAAKKLGNKIRVAKMDSDEEGDTSTKLRVGGLPTLILFDRSGQQVQRFEGAMMEDQIIEMVQAAQL
eukprot:Skav216223  [mRNA]  locus=scaffold238:376997:377854:+ [translate_table: standard]